MYQEAPGLRPAPRVMALAFNLTHEYSISGGGAGETRAEVWISWLMTLQRRGLMCGG